MRVREAQWTKRFTKSVTSMATAVRLNAMETMLHRNTLAWVVINAPAPSQ